MKHGSLFSGIGGFDLAARWAGIECTWQVELDGFCQKVLSKHFPEAKRYKDINDVRLDELETVDIISGGFPCQPFSQAGKQRGKEDDRYLWPKMLEVISNVKPRWVLGENVPGIINMELDQVLSDLEATGYTTETFIIPAVSINAPHRRDRVWVVGYTKGIRGGGIQGRVWERQAEWVKNSGSNVADTNTTRHSERLQPENTCQRGRYVPDPERQGLHERHVPQTRQIARHWGEFLQNWETEPDVGRVAHGVSTELDSVIRRLGYEDVNRKKAITEIDKFRREMLRSLWESGQVATSSFRYSPTFCFDFMPEMPYESSYECRYLGQRIETDEALYDLWGKICSKPFKETQDLQSKMLVRIREIECSKTLGQNRVDRLKSLGNAIVPQIAYLFFSAIMEIENETNTQTLATRD